MLKFMQIINNLSVTRAMLYAEAEITCYAGSEINVLIFGIATETDVNSPVSVTLIHNHCFP